MSSPVTAPGIAPGSGAATPARHFSEPYRQLGALALLIANAVLIFLGVTGLLFVIDGWADGFGARSAAQFGVFVGPWSIGLPFVAMLIATHVVPMVPRSRAVLLTVLIEYGVSALFGVITFLGAFAHDLGSARDTIEGLIGRSVWLALLVLAAIVVSRVLTGLYPPSPPRPYPYGAPVYGRPYPGQPVYPPTAFQPGTADPTAASAPVVPPAAESEVAGGALDDALFASSPTPGGWPVVPPPPMPAPLTIPAPAAPPVVEHDPTVRVNPLTGPLNGEVTQLLPPPAGQGDSPAQPDNPPGGTDGPPADSAEPPSRETER